MGGVARVLNTSNLGTRKLAKVRRCCLMYLIGLGVAAGEEEFNLYMQMKCMGKSMKVIRRVVFPPMSQNPW